jgi:hypothetical protein
MDSPATTMSLYRCYADISSRQSVFAIHDKSPEKDRAIDDHCDDFQPMSPQSGTGKSLNR